MTIKAYEVVYTTRKGKFRGIKIAKDLEQLAEVMGEDYGDLLEYDNDVKVLPLGSVFIQQISLADYIRLQESIK